MDFDPPARSASLVPAVRELVRSEVIPLERGMGGRGFSAIAGELEGVRQKVKSRGWWAPTLPPELGGMGLSLLEFAFVGEEIGRSPLGPYCFNCQAPDVGNMEILVLHGSEEQKRRFLLPLAKGEIRSCFSMTEPGRPGSNPAWMDTQARREGDDYLIDGHKWFTSSADGARFAIVMAVTDPDAPP
jgi:alkylation response protein AidB-like acyl-CoA dehydrogenase